MFTMDIFNSNAFGVVEMTDAINIVPNYYGRLQELGLFSAKPISTTVVAIDYKNGQIALIPSGTRGGPAPRNKSEKRKLRTFSVPHLPLEDRITADQIQNVRAFGRVDPINSVMAVVNEKLAEMAVNHYQTWEWHRVGAIRGKIMDADGTELLNLFTTFGITEKSVNFALATAGTNVRNKCLAVKRHIEKELKGEIATEIRGLCSPSFFEALVSHPKVEETFKYQESQNLRDDIRKNFSFGGIIWEEYVGEATDPDGSTHKFIPDDRARIIPLGTTNTFKKYEAPADFIETVNTLGRPLYSKVAVDEKFQRFVDVHTQSNPLFLCHRPGLLVEAVK